MGTSTKQHQPTVVVNNNVAAAAAVATSSSTFCRRDSTGSCSGAGVAGGGTGTNNFLTNNVIVRGPSPTGCGHSKREGQVQASAGNKKNADLLLSSVVAVVVTPTTTARRAAGDDGDGTSSPPSLPSLVGVSGPASPASSEDGNSGDYSSSAFDLLSRDATLTTNTPMDVEEARDINRVLLSTALPFKASHHHHQQTAARKSAVVSSSGRQMSMDVKIPSSHQTSSFLGVSASTAASASRSSSSPDDAASKALQTMQRIIDLNQTAICHYLSSAGTVESSAAADNWALDALHKAEWIRCHLADELASSAATQRSRAGITESDASQGYPTKTAQYSSKKGISLSFTSGSDVDFSSVASAASLTQSPRRPKAMRRSDSFGDPRDYRRHQRRPFSSSVASDGGDDNDNDIARTSYIYQRMDFDEGMHSFADLEVIDPADFWLRAPKTGDDDNDEAEEERPLLEMSPAVESTLLFNVGQILRRSGDLDSASKCYDRALEILQREGDNDLTDEDEARQHHPRRLHPIAVPILHNIGQLQYRRGDTSAAVEAYRSALRRAKEMHGSRHPHVASALNCLGVLYYHDANSGEEEDDEEEAAKEPDEIDDDDMDGDDDYDDKNDHSIPSTRRAMNLFQRALSIRLQSLGPDHVDVATVLNNIGRIHVQLDEFEQALGCYGDALRIRRSVLGPDSLDYAATAFNAGQSHHQRGDLVRAAELYHEFLRVALTRFGHSHRDVAVVLSGIAQIHQERRENDKALELYEASLCAGRAALGENHSEIAMLLNRMGNFHFEQERLEDALRCYKRGLKIERAVLPPDHPNIVVTLSNLGEIHRQRGEWDEAAEMYTDCLEILRKKHDGKDNIDVATTLSTLGLIHDQRGHMCLSLQYLQDALLMRRRLLGNDHLDVSATLVYIGTILYRKSVFSVAIELFSESLWIRHAALGKDHRDVAFVLYNIALVHQQRGCYEEAIESYSETLRIEKLVLGEKHRDVAMTMFKLGEVNKAAGNLDEALECFRNSVAVERSLALPSSDVAASSPSTAEDATVGQSRSRQQQTGSDHAAMARALNEIGNIHLARGEAELMMEAFSEASRLYRVAGLSPNNVVVSGHLYAFESSCPEAAPAA